MIDPLQLQSVRPSTALFEREPPKKTGASSFDKLLNALQSDGGESRKLSVQAGAELLRIEMMQSCLSLSDNTEAPHSYRSQALATLLGSLDEKSRSVRAPGTAPAAPEEIPAPIAAPGTATGALEETAARFIGTPYLFGGEGPSGIDCSSFVQQVFGEHNIELPRTALEQSKVGSEVAVQDLRKGDLVFFATYASYPSHVGIYLGDGKMIHASSAKGEVVVSDMNSSYYQSRFLGAKRVA